jgi:hypothetical protein
MVPGNVVKRAAFFGLVAWGVMLVAAKVWAERPTAPHMLPEKTLFYVRVADAQEALAAFQQTSIGRILQDEQVRPLVQKLYQSASEAYQQIEDRVGLSLDELLQLPQGELCFAFVESPEGPLVPVLFFDVRDKMPLADRLMARIFEQLGERGVPVRVESYQGTDISVLGNQSDAVCLFAREGTVVVSSNLELSKQFIDLWGGSSEFRTLADNPAFAAIMQQSVGTKQERPQLSWFLDAVGLFRNVGRGNLTMQVAISLLNPLGLDGVEGMGGSLIMTTEDFDTIGHFHILVRSPRRGIPKMLALVSGDNEPEPWVPQDIVSYMTLHWDVKTTIAELTSLYDLIRLQDGAFAQLVQERVSTPLGVDVLSEVVPLLEGRITMVTGMERPVRLNSQVTLVGIKLRDAAKGQEILNKIVEKFPQAFEKETFGTHTIWRIRPQGAQPDFEANNLRRPEPALAMLEDYVVITDSVQFLKKCLGTTASGGQTLAQDAQFRLVSSRMREHIAGRTPAMVIFSKPEESMRALYELATAETTRSALSRAATNNPFFRTLDNALQEHPLPPFSEIQKYLAPAGAVMVSDETGFHYIGFGLRPK